MLERQLAFQERLQRAGRIKHEHLFFTATGEPIRRLHVPYSHWRRTLQRLPIRYRKPYTARHSSVSWDLMIGRNPLWVAQQHGHSLLTMLRVYAARTADAPETNTAAIREAMGRIDRKPAAPADGRLQTRLAVDLPVRQRFATGVSSPSAVPSPMIADFSVDPMAGSEPKSGSQ